MNFLLLYLPFAAISQEIPSSDKAVAALPNLTASKSVILIDAKARCDDIVKAFDLLKKEKPTFRISARISNGQILSNVVEVTALPQGTLFVLKLSTSQGMKYQLLSVDDFLDFFFP